MSDPLKDTDHTPIPPTMEQRIAELERQLDIVCQQLGHAQRAIYCLGLVPPYSGRLPRPKMAKGHVQPMLIPSGFTIVMGEGESVGQAIITAIHKNGRQH